MRLNLYWRGQDVVDVELHVWRKRPDDMTTDDGPRIEASGGGSSERASSFGDPATIAGFGFQSGHRHGVRMGSGQVVMGPQQPRPKTQQQVPSPPPRSARCRGCRADELAGEEAI